jgi:hypothetical protein
MKSQKYEALLTKALENFCEASDKLASIATNYDLLEGDVNYAQELTKSRVGELKKQLEHKPVKVEVKLPSANHNEVVDTASSTSKSRFDTPMSDSSASASFPNVNS